MIITTYKHTQEDQLLSIQKTLEDLGAQIHRVDCEESVSLVVIHESLKQQDVEKLNLQGVDTVLSTSKPYKIVSRDYSKHSSVVSVGGISIGGNTLQVISGPCSVETEIQMRTAAQQVRRAGCRLMRGGAYKPRTSPYNFQGHGEKGLEYLSAAGKSQQLPIVTELMDVRDIDLFSKYHVDAIQIGTRNMQNYDLLKEVGRSRIPVILKRGMSATVNEWLLSAEYIAAGGNSNIILCERGVRSFEPAYRNMLDVTSVIVAKKESHLPVIIDPSHAGGKAWMVPALSHAAIAVGADGLLIEMHPTPSLAWSDADQALSPDELSDLMLSLGNMALSLGRELLPKKKKAYIGSKK